MEVQTWDNLFKTEKEKSYFLDLEKYINDERKLHKVFPETNDVYNAFELTPLKDLKVVIIGQDPYHKVNQAHGLSFSVTNNVKTPPSLVNIYKELKTDLHVEIPKYGNLTSWAKQGVLMLNAVLTVREGQPGSHQKKGWEIFTDEVIKHISENTEHTVFLLWGNFAKTKFELINASKHLILQAAHPSPLARGAFFGCKHFSITNEYLERNKKPTINWDLNCVNLFS